MLPLMSFRSGSRDRAVLPLASLLLFALVASGLWLHRFELAQPSAQSRGLQIDTYLQFYPTAVFMHDELQNGRLPLWNPYQMAGQPTLGMHVPAVLYPPNLLLFGLLPAKAALTVHAVVHLFLAGLFAWLFAGRLGLGFAARLVAGFAFMLCPGLLVGLYMAPFLSTPVWLPAMLWSLHGLVSEARPRWALALAASIGLSFLGGHVQAFVYCVQISGLYGFFALGFVARRGRRLRVCGLALAAGLLGLAFAAPQLLPALELVRGSVRGLDGLSLVQAGFTSLTPAMLLEGLWGAFAVERVLNYAILPLLTLPLAVCAFLSRRHRSHAVFFLLLTVILGLFLTGLNSPVFRLYYELPLGNLFRNPHRMGFAYALCGALLAAMGTDTALRWLGAGRVPARLSAMLGVLIVTGIAADRYAGTEFTHAHPAVDGPVRGAPKALLDFLKSRPGLDRVFLERVGWYNPRILRKAGMMNQLFFIPDYEPNMPGDYLRFLGVEDYSLWHGDLRLAGHVPAIGLRADPRRLDLMSARHYAIAQPAPKRITATLRGLTGHPRQNLGNGSRVYTRHSALPRLYSVRRARYAADFTAALGQLDAEGFDPRTEAVLIGQEPEEAAEASPPPPRDSADVVAIVEYTPQRVTARADCAARCLVILTDLHYPGWHLRVDGESMPIERVNGIFRGAWLEPGAHRLVYDYAPASFQVGLALCGTGLFAATGVAAYTAHRRRRGGSRADQARAGSGNPR